jgi:hypothetical protein
LKQVVDEVLYSVMRNMLIETQDVSLHDNRVTDPVRQSNAQLGVVAIRGCLHALACLLHRSEDTRYPFQKQLARSRETSAAGSAREELHTQFFFEFLYRPG